MRLDFFIEEECIAIVAQMEDEFKVFMELIAERTPELFGRDDRSMRPGKIYEKNHGTYD